MTITTQTVTLLFVGVVSTALLLSCAVLFLRALLILRTRRQARCLATWEPILLDATQGSPPALLPRLPGADLMTFLGTWNHLQESVIGSASEGLNDVARRVGIPARAARLLRYGNLREKLTAIVTMGQLQERSEWATLCTYSRVADVPLSLASARALVHIDPAGAVKHLMPLVLARADWPAARVATLLVALGPDLISEALAAAALAAPPEHAPRLIRYLHLIHAETAIPAVRRIIRLSDDLEVITACLRVLEDPEDLGIVRSFCEDPRWQVRVQAASALGRIGLPDDVPRLGRLVADAEWWVRHRAAEALCAVLANAPEALDQLETTHYNEFARDALAHVRAEIRVH
jgi:hypothetical protein